MTGNRSNRGKRRSSFVSPRKKQTESSGADKVARAAVIDLIRKIPFDHYTGDYEGLVNSLREEFNSFKPEECVSEMEQYFGVDISKEASEEKRLIAILRKLDAYLFAFDNKTLYELITEDDAKEPKKHVLKGSTFTGFKESYTDTILDTVRVGYYPLRHGVDKIINEHQKDPPPSSEVLFGWRMPLVVLMIMFCEAARFHPISDLILDLWNNQTRDIKLPKGMILFMKSWAHMSSVARGELPDNGDPAPILVDLYDEAQAKRVKDSQLGAKSVLAFEHRGKQSDEGTSQDFWKEALILSSLHYPNAVSFYGLVHGGPDGSLATVKSSWLWVSHASVTEKRQAWT